MRHLLDPKRDLVFKLLLADERNREILKSFLTAVLAPPEPIVEVEVLNPETPRETLQQKGAVLDVRIRLLDGTLINVEMQAAWHAGLWQRVLYYGARQYAGQLVQGDRYQELAPVVTVFVLGFARLPTERFHSVFRFREDDEHFALTSELSVHVLELPKLPPGPPAAGEPSVLSWCRFFAAQSDEELEQVAMVDSNIRRAKQALERLSADPFTQQLLREQEIWAWNYENTLRLTRREGEEEGRAEGKAEGRAEGKAEGRAEGEATALLAVLAARGVSVSEEQSATIRDCRDFALLETWLRRAISASSCEDVLRAT